MDIDGCVWDIYDVNTRGLLGVGLYISGLASLIACGFVLVVFLKSSLANERSYLMLFHLCAACMVRSLLAGFLFSGVSAVAGRWIFGSHSCVLYGFLKQLIGVIQMEAVTHLCIERYVRAKYTKYGWEMTQSLYVLFVGLCWLFSVLYSYPTLFGVGDYGLDFSCTSCTLDLLLPQDTWSKYILVCILLLQSVKPMFFIVPMLYWARQLETQCYKEPKHLEHILFTKSAIKVTCTALLCWAPTFLSSAWVLIPQLMEGTIAQPPVLLAMTATLGSEIAPGAICISMLWTNKGLHQSMLALFGEPTHTKDE